MEWKADFEVPGLGAKGEGPDARFWPLRALVWDSDALLRTRKPLRICVSGFGGGRGYDAKPGAPGMPSPRPYAENQILHLLP